MTVTATKPSEEKTKPFRLVKYFSFTSLIVIFLGTIILSLLNIHWARSLQFRKSKEYALLLIENLNHQVYTQFQIPVYYLFGKIQLREHRQFELMDRIVRNTLHSFKIDMVNIYDVKTNIISYSFNPEDVGKKDIGGKEYQKALKGESTSRLIQKGNMWEILLGIPKEIKVTTFAPLREARPLTPISGNILGVVEIVQDLSEDYQAIFRFQIRIILTSTIVMLLLLIILIFVVKRGENIIQQRTLERIQLKEQLIQAERLSSLGGMIAGISHEIRNPLGIIKSSAELLRKKLPEHPIMNVILEESNRLNHILSDFLNYAKPASPHFISCHLFDIIDKNISFLSLEINSQEYCIKKKYCEDIPLIKADPDMLYQVFLNILMNAMQSMPGGGEIQIEIAKENDKKVKVLIKDKGQGVPEECIEKIWDPFFTTKETGTGLGLGIVKNIIEAHQGTVLIENRPIYGTQVTIKLPAVLEDNNGNHSDC